MSEENVATVRAIWEAVNSGDIDEAFEYAPDDFVADWSGSEAPESGVYRGRDAVKARFERTLEVWSEMEYFETEIIDAGDQVVRVGGVRARGRGSGAEVMAQGAQVWTFRDGKPVSVRLFQSKEEALEALGLSG
ncbi:MAG TPA: nuclear transport factor 2 family protein [Solirubrobacterales bacterium]|nr:nuclear transport factor 2 family protein [Solirubrobacterales bacterium]